jgi:ribonuclease III
MGGRSPRPTGGALVERLAHITGHRFGDTALLERALTHASLGGREKGNYEQLEFLGDRVLGLLVADMLIRRFPEASEGDLAPRLNALVSREACAGIAEETGLTELIRADIGLKALQTRKAHNVRADVVESLIAAIYRDGGLEAVRPFIERHWTARMEEGAEPPREPKTALQEWAVTQDGAVPAYAIEERAGPDHDPVFTVSVSVRGFAPERGTGSSRRRAEQAAASALLIREGVWTTP